MTTDHDERLAEVRAERARSNDPRMHTTPCLERSVDAFDRDEPDPGCTCGGAVFPADFLTAP